MFRLRIVTIEDVIADAKVSRLSVPTPKGRTGILSGHVPLLTSILPGEARYHTEDKEHRLVVTSGSLEIKDNVATLLVDEALPVAEVDLKKAQAQRERLLNILEKSADLPVYELEEARRELRNVMAKIKVAGPKTAGPKR